MVRNAKKQIENEETPIEEIKDMKNKSTSKFNINDIEGMKEYINK